MNHRAFRSIRMLLLTLSLGALACDVGDVAALFGGASKPTVVITSPPSGSQYQEGQDVAIQSTSTDDKGIVRVELIVDGVVVRTDPLPNPQPQFALIQIWKATQGSHTLTVRAYNTANAPSDPVAIMVAVSPSIALGATPASTSASPGPALTPAPGVTIAPPPTSAPAPCSNDAAFVADVTVPNGTVFAAGQTFNKIWRVRNAGTCSWGLGYDFAFVGGEAMGGTPVVAVPNTDPGATADLLIAMTAPSGAGTHSGQWRLRSSGVAFGATLNVSINVPPSAPPCPGPPVIASFSASPNPITAGGSTTLSWGAVTNATSAVIDHGIGGVATPGSKSVNPATTTTYTLTATGCGGTATSQVTVTVNPAPPSPATTQVLAQSSVGAGATGSTTVQCPSGTIVTGGGFASQHTIGIEIYNSSKDGNGWRVYVKNGTGAGVLLNSYAICISNSSGSTTQVLQQVSVNAGSTGHSTVSCPAGSVVTGGGFAWTTSGEVYTESKQGNGWEVYANNTTGSSQLLNAYAICMSGTSASTTQVLNQVPIAANSTGSATASCSGSSILTGGGFASTADLGTSVYTQSKEGNGWRAYMNNTLGSSKLLNAYAICASF